MTKQTKPIIRIHNTETDEVIDREMNDAEFAEYEADQATRIERKNEIDASAATKSALLDRLGISESEAKLLLS